MDWIPDDINKFINRNLLITIHLIIKGAIYIPVGRFNFYGKKANHGG
jgi:hypothetical protein